MLNLPLDLLSGSLEVRGDLPREVLDYLYANSWACKRVCDLKPDLMSSAWGELQLKKYPELIEKLKPQLAQLRKIYCEGQKIANLYGGATAIRYINQDTDWLSPININKIQSVSYSRVFDKWEIYPDTSDLAINRNPAYPQFYQYSYLYDGSSQINKIHHSRIIRFRGAFLSPQGLIDNDFWENSLLKVFLDPYLEYYRGKKYISLALKSFSLPVIKKRNLIEVLSQEFARGTQSVAQRLKDVFAQLSSDRGVALDSETEEILFIDRKFQGLKDIIDSLQCDMVAASGLTKPQLLKEHPNGLSATGESERLAESQELLAIQNNLWGDLIQEDIKLLLAQYNIYDGYDWQWTNSYQNTPLEDIKIKETQCNIDEKYITLGTYNQLEVRASRFSQSKYNPDLILNDQLFNQTSTMDNPTPNDSMTSSDNAFNQDAENNKFIPVDNTLLPNSFYDEAMENLENIEEEE